MTTDRVRGEGREEPVMFSKVIPTMLFDEVKTPYSRSRQTLVVHTEGS